MRVAKRQVVSLVLLLTARLSTCLGGYFSWGLEPFSDFAELLPREKRVLAVRARGPHLCSWSVKRATLLEVVFYRSFLRVRIALFCRKMAVAFALGSLSSLVTFLPW